MQVFQAVKCGCVHVIKFTMWCIRQGKTTPAHRQGAGVAEVAEVADEAGVALTISLSSEVSDKVAARFTAHHSTPISTHTI